MTNKWISWVLYALLAAGGIVMVLPFVWMISTSLKSPSEVMIMPPKWIPSMPNWSNYVKAWQMASFSQYLLNSVIVTVATTAGEIITTILAAFAFFPASFFLRTRYAVYDPAGHYDGSGRGSSHTELRDAVTARMDRPL